jgi:putative aminotransferase
MTIDHRISRLDERAVYGRDLCVVRAENATVWLRDDTGNVREYIDLMSAYGAVNFGHMNPEICAMVQGGADIVAASYPPEAYEVATWLTDRLSRPEHRVLFQTGGSHAVGAALALCLQARPGRVACIRGSFHGLGLEALSITDVQRGSAIQASLLPMCTTSAVEWIEVGGVAPDWSEISCVIYEPVQGANGYVPLPEEWLREVLEEARRAGALVVADEIQAGFYRHGLLAASERICGAADVLLFSKSLTNGLYPLSAVVFPAALEDNLPVGPYGSHTFQTGCLGYRAARAVERWIDTHPVADLADVVRDRLAQTADLLEAMSGVVEVHVTGPTLSFATPHAREIVETCAQRGVLLFTGSRDGGRVRIAPPLTSPHEQLDWALAMVQDITESTAN